jgi:hypothetical protein
MSIPPSLVTELKASVDFHPEIHLLPYFLSQYKCSITVPEALASESSTTLV